jgi:hypothetical protein
MLCGWKKREKNGELQRLQTVIGRRAQQMCEYKPIAESNDFILLGRFIRIWCTDESCQTNGLPRNKLLSFKAIEL